jgi:hypothetical protein
MIFKIQWTDIPMNVRANLIQSLPLSALSITRIQEELDKFKAQYLPFDNCVIFKSEKFYLLFLLKWG